MLNNKGFTIAEVIVSFTLVTMILLAIIGSTVFYRDKLKVEEVKSQLVDFKNNITKEIYDDVINNKIVSIDSCLDALNCYNLTDESGVVHTLKIHEIYGKNGMFLSYNGNDYLLPDSDLSGEDDDGNVIRTCDFTNGIGLAVDNNLYTIKISYSHRDYDVQNSIIVTGPDKEAVGQLAAEIRKVRPPEPYKGKGIKYVGERIIRKEGKLGKK